MKKLVLGIILCGALFSCSNNAKLDEAIELQIVAYEDSLANLVRNPLSHEQSESFLDNYLEVLEKAVKQAPKNDQAATYMDRIHMLASAKRDLDKSLKFAVRLIEEFPEYANRPMVLKSLAYMYDAEVQPRDTNSVKKYYSLYLEENSGIDVDERDMIDKRLLMLHIPFDKFLILERQLVE